MPNHSPAILLSYLSDRQKKFVSALVSSTAIDMDAAIMKSLGISKDVYDTERSSIMRFLHIDARDPPEVQRHHLTGAYHAFLTLSGQQRLKQHAQTSSENLWPKNNFTKIKRSTAAHDSEGYSQAFKHAFVGNIKAIAKLQGRSYSAVGKKVGKSSVFMKNLEELSARVNTDIIKAFAQALEVESTFLAIGHLYLVDEIKLQLKQYKEQREGARASRRI